MRGLRLLPKQREPTSRFVPRPTAAPLYTVAVDSHSNFSCKSGRRSVIVISPSNASVHRLSPLYSTHLTMPRELSLSCAGSLDLPLLEQSTDLVLLCTTADLSGLTADTLGCPIPCYTHTHNEQRGLFLAYRFLAAGRPTACGQSQGHHPHTMLYPLKNYVDGAG